MKWIPVIILLVLAGLAAFVAVEYFTVAIHALPSYIPGHKGTLPGHHHGARGHYRKRGAVAAVIAVIFLAIAGWLAVRNRRSDRTSGTTAPATV